MMLPPARARTPSLLVSECFGPTLRGEGPSTGQLALFIRLARCNLSCPGCDTPYTWDWSRFDPAAESRRFDVDMLVEWAVGSQARLVVVTGGEPLLQQDSLVAMVARLGEVGQRVEIETNGTVPPSPALLAVTYLFVVSPKLASFATVVSPANRINGEALAGFVASERAIFMFVVQHRADFDEIADLEQRFGLHPIWVMPDGTTPGRVLAGMTWLADTAVVRGWHLSGRLQVLLRRGRGGRPDSSSPQDPCLRSGSLHGPYR